MKCPYCSRPGLKKLKGYCCRAHRKLHRKPPAKMVPCASCGSPQRRVPSTISKSGKVYCNRCKRGSGEMHYKWGDGTFIDKAGYRMMLIDSIYKREHRLVWEEANHARLFPNGSVHHIRFDLPDGKLYNDPDNLVLLTEAEHARFHRLFEAERYIEAFSILLKGGLRQLHWPVEIDKFISSVMGNQETSLSA